jgi:predicted nucleotidyltransferase
MNEKKPRPNKKSITMLIEDRKILEKLAKKIRNLYPGARVWAFGSRARGDASWESDFDVFIVLLQKDESVESAIRNICWEVGFENDRVITSVILDKVQFENGPMSESTLVENILREGVAG